MFCPGSLPLSGFDRIQHLGTLGRGNLLSRINGEDFPGGALSTDLESQSHSGGESRYTV